MSNVRGLTQPKAKSKQIIIDCLRRCLKLVVRREMVLCAIVFIDSSGKYHFDRIGPVNSDQKDKLLEGIEQLHEEIYTSI